MTKVKKLSVELCDEAGRVINQWSDVLTATILDLEIPNNSSRCVKITKKDGRKIYLLVASNNTLILEEYFEEEQN